MIYLFVKRIYALKVYCTCYKYKWSFRFTVGEHFDELISTMSGQINKTKVALLLFGLMPVFKMRPSSCVHLLYWFEAASDLN
jgi:hypothetical protein